LAIAAPFAAAQQDPAPDAEEEVEEDERAAAPQQADAAVAQDRPVMLRVGGSRSWDSNIFRQPAGAARQERINQAYVGLSIDKPYAQQRFRLDITETAYRYENFSHLDFDALNYLGAWGWRLGPRLGGTLSAARAESLADYSEFRNPSQRNV
jgi:hypothetical protein